MLKEGGLAAEVMGKVLSATENFCWTGSPRTSEPQCEGSIHCKCNEKTLEGLTGKGLDKGPGPGFGLKGGIIF